MDEVMAGRWYRSPFTLPDGGHSFSEVWAESLGKAQAIADKRGFGPAAPYNGPKLREFRPSVLATQPGGLANPHTLHSLCYVAFLAARSGVVTAEELVRDGGALHELAHALIGPRMRGGRQVEIAIEAMRALERKTPGIPPEHVVLALPAAPLDRECAE